MYKNIEENKTTQFCFRLRLIKNKSRLIHPITWIKNLLFRSVYFLHTYNLAVSLIHFLLFFFGISPSCISLPLLPSITESEFRDCEYWKKDWISTVHNALKSDFSIQLTDLKKNIRSVCQVSTFLPKAWFCINYLPDGIGKILAFQNYQLEKSTTTKLWQIHKYPCVSRPGILYSMDKVHKPVINPCPSLRPILSAINTPSHKLAKFLVPVLTPLTSTISL